MLQEENITMPRWFLEKIEDTLRIQNNINQDKKTGETCQDRNVKESLNGVRKLLKGEELTGGERLERLQPPPIPSGDGQPEVGFEIGKYMTTHLLKKRNHSTGIFHITQKDYGTIASHFYELGINTRKED